MTDDAVISLLIVDDHPVVRDGLRGMFRSAPGFRVLGEAANGVEALERAAALDPDVVLMDLRMPGGSGVDAIRELARRGAPPKVLVLTTYDTDSDTLPAIEAGATGYLLKDAPRDELFTASVRRPRAGPSSPRPSPPAWSPRSAPPGRRAANPLRPRARGARPGRAGRLQQGDRP